MRTRRAFIATPSRIHIVSPGAAPRQGRSQSEAQVRRGLPLDYADATLVVLAEELDTNLVFTTDRRDFAICRIEGRRRFDILPG